MATQSFSVIAEDDLTCPVCFELLKDPNTPKLLDCPHVCCAVCIQKMIEGGRRIVDCPECRHVTGIPEEGVAAMRTSLRIRSLAEKHEEHTKKAQATVPNQDPSKKTQTTAAMCPEHNVVIDFYCKKCNTAGCSSCMMFRHQGPQHDNDQVQNVHEKQKEHIETIFKQGAKEIEESEQSVQELEALQDEMEKSVNIQYKNIEKQVELVMKKVNKEAQSLKDSIQKKEQPRIERVQQERNRLQNQIQEAASVITTAKNTVETTERHEYVVTHDRLVQTIITSLSKDTKGKINRNMAIGMAKYVHKPLNVRGILGKTLQVRELECEFIDKFCEFQYAIAIAATASGVLVMSDSIGRQVRIYSQHKEGQYTWYKDLSLSSKNTTNEPHGVAVTAEGKYLVARWTHVEVYSPSGKYEGIVNFTQVDGKGNKVEHAYTLKVMPDGRIVVADRDKSLLTILSQEEIFVGAVHTSIKPGRIAVMPHGYIAVANWRDGKVCVIDLESGREVQTLDIPHASGICYHEQTDCLLVGRCLVLTDGGYPKAGTGVIDQYCSTTGRLVARLAKGLYSPEDLAFTPDGMLAVADKKIVKVYKVL